MSVDYIKEHFCNRVIEITSNLHCLSGRVDGTDEDKKKWRDAFFTYATSLKDSFVFEFGFPFTSPDLALEDLESRFYGSEPKEFPEFIDLYFGPLDKTLVRVYLDGDCICVDKEAFKMWHEKMVFANQ